MNLNLTSLINSNPSATRTVCHTSVSSFYFWFSLSHHLKPWPHCSQVLINSKIVLEETVWSIRSSVQTCSDNIGRSNIYFVSYYCVCEKQVIPFICGFSMIKFKPWLKILFYCGKFSSWPHAVLCVRSWELSRHWQTMQKTDKNYWEA